MHESNIRKITNIVLIWIGIAFLANGLQKMSDSGYTPPEMVLGWLTGMLWIVFGYAIALMWCSFMISTLISQKISGSVRFSGAKMFSMSLVLIFAAISASVGTYLTWKHPYRLGPCGCQPNEWGPLCKECQCGLHGVCHDGEYGSGRCACDFGFAGDRCDRCDERHKPEPNGILPACDTCKTGYIGEKCNLCDVGYSGEDCSLCDHGWRPWQHSSQLFPQTIAEDGRHLCDECLPNYWGYYCKACPWGNDVPHVILTENNPLIKGTRVADSSLKGGHIRSMQLKDGETWKSSYNYNPTDPRVLQHTKIQIKYDHTNVVSDWILLEDIHGVQCNNRGTCEDDATHQQKNPTWQDTCTFTEYQQCTTNSDCTVSGNCKGTCVGDFSVNSIWEAKMGGALCSTNEDCIDTTIINEKNEIYTGGRCVDRGCCDESHHGSGLCECLPRFFGPEQQNTDKQHYEMSPSCDFCPGYDWITQNPIFCSGGKGTCSASYDRSGNYLQMRCTCGKTELINPETGIVDMDKIVAWSGDLCECGDFNEDGQCDLCSSGHWGTTCQTCPGGPGAKSCGGLGRGECSQGIHGDGSCSCALDRASSWMLAPYVKRYASETVGVDSNGQNHTCSECAPNFFGEFCLRCADTDMIKPTEIEDIFQPGGSYVFGQGQSSLEPKPVCHRGFCTLACGGGGWCNWGKGGDGTCTCWSNQPGESHTWNPLDNVCIGTDTTNQQCPAYGYCSGLSTDRNSATMCDENQVCGSGTCYPWTQIDWTNSNSLITCVKKGN